MSEEQIDPTTPQPDPETGLTHGVSQDNGEDVTAPMPYPHDVQPGYGVTGKFPTDDADAGVVVSAPASETDALEVGAPAPDTAEQPAAEADQLDVPAEQRGDTA